MWNPQAKNTLKYDLSHYIRILFWTVLSIHNVAVWRCQTKMCAVKRNTFPVGITVVTATAGYPSFSFSCHVLNSFWLFDKTLLPSARNGASHYRRCFYGSGRGVQSTIFTQDVTVASVTCLAFCETGRLITVFSRDQHWNLSLTRWI
jgi:hypothetical protein